MPIYNIAMRSHHVFILILCLFFSMAASAQQAAAPDTTTTIEQQEPYHERESRTLGLRERLEALRQKRLSQQSTPLSSHSLTVDGKVRHYLLHTPATLKEEKPSLLIALHGGMGSAQRLVETTSLTQWADREGFLLALPDAYGNQWIDGRANLGEEIDDVHFLQSLVESLAASHAIHKDRVFLIGISNGGMMSFRMACEAADSISAIAIISASMPADFAPRCTPARPVPVILFSGTDDKLIPFAGGKNRIITRGSDVESAGVWSHQQTKDFWLSHNQCDLTKETRHTLDAQSSDGTRVKSSLYDDCVAKSHFYVIEGGGHNWPGAKANSHRLSFLNGIMSKEIDATARAIEFFSSLDK